jgi:hypothetical protein
LGVGEVLECLSAVVHITTCSPEGDELFSGRENNPLVETGTADRGSTPVR